MDQNSTDVSYIALLTISRALLAFGSNSSRGEQAPRKTSLCLSFCVAEKVPNMTEGASINEHHDGKGVLVLWMVMARLEVFMFTGHLFQLFSIFSRTTVCTSESSCGIFLDRQRFLCPAPHPSVQIFVHSPYVMEGHMQH